MAKLTFPTPTSIENLKEPVNSTDAATKQYVDNKLSTGYNGSSGSGGSGGGSGSGYFGSKGFTGSVGYTGSASTGYTGSVGDTGSEGPSGIQGEDGPIGYTGSSGEFAAIGFTGSQGEPGPPGPGGGGAGIGEDQVLITNTTPSVDTITGALLVSGGVGIVGDLFAGTLNTDGNIQVGGLTISEYGLSASPGTTAALVGVYSYSTYFNGTDCYFSFLNDSFLCFNEGDFTIDFWCKFPGNNDQSVILDGRSANGAFYLSISGSGASGKLTYGLTGTQSTKSITDNVWHHCAVTRENGSVTIWIDGVAGGRTRDTINYNYAGGYWLVGNSYNDSQKKLSGYIHSLRIIVGVPALYTEDFAPNRDPSLPDPGTMLLLFQTVNLADNSSFNRTITEYGALSTTNVVSPQIVKTPTIFWKFNSDGQWTSTTDIIIQSQTQASMIPDFGILTPDYNTGALQVAGGASPKQAPGDHMALHFRGKLYLVAIGPLCAARMDCSGGRFGERHGHRGPAPHGEIHANLHRAGKVFGRSGRCVTSLVGTKVGLHAHPDRRQARFPALSPTGWPGV